MRVASLLACFLLGFLAAGCAAWLGDIPQIKVDPEHAAEHPVQRASVILFVDRPEVVDNDEDKDFTPIAEKFSLDLPQRIAEYACARNAFARCSDKPLEGAYRLSSKVIVDNFRQGHGGFAGTILGGMLLPPLLGIAWSMPVCGGSCDYRVQWALHAPSGEQLWQFEGVLGYGLMSCEGDKKVGEFLVMALNEALPGMSNAALGAEELAAKARAAKPVEAASPVPVPEPEARREVLAVFDIQDVSDRIEKKELLQLTAFLATAMATTGKFTVVPREQLRERLMDEKKVSYRKCFDSVCQIELGKAVAAEKTLATQLLQVGEECAVVANLYDLHSETSSAAAMVQTGCEEKKLLGAMKQVAEQIAAQVK
jgi:hypothetical protein